MEKLVKKQLESYFEKKGILPHSQFGFRQELSTQQALFATMHDWLEAKQKKEYCGSCLFDLTAAYDVCDPSLLEAKCQLYGCDWLVTKWIRSYLTGRNQCVEINEKKSELRTVNIGTPQGSVLSPLLYLIMVSDIEEWITSGKLTCFADDSTLYVRGETKLEVRKKLEEGAKQVLSFMNATNLKANATKTHFIMFNAIKEPPIKVNEALIEESNEVELLGVVFNKHLNWTSHINKLESQLRQRIGILRRLSWKFPKQLAVQLIDPLFTSKVRYSLPLIYKKELPMKKLQGLHRLAMKAALRLKSTHNISTEELVRLTNQKSLTQIAKEIIATLAWKTSPKWKTHPLFQDRIREQPAYKITRQSKNAFPKQFVAGSIITDIIELWQEMPKHILEEKIVSAAKREIVKWCNKSE